MYTVNMTLRSLFSAENVYQTLSVNLVATGAKCLSVECDYGSIKHTGPVIHEEHILCGTSTSIRCDVVAGYRCGYRSGRVGDRPAGVRMVRGPKGG